MSSKEKAARAGTQTASDTAFDKADSTSFDHLQGWIDLIKPSRNRQQKSSWKRGNQQGRIDAYLLALLVLMFISALLIVGGLAHA
jgi:hypothetical protein